MTLAALGIEAKTDGVDKATDQLDRLAGAAGGAEKATDRLRDSSGRFVKAGNDAAGAAGKAAEGVKGLGGEARTTEGALAKMAGALGTTTGALARFIAGTVTFGAFALLVRKGADDMDAVAKSARRVEGTVTGFRAMELAAGEAGVAVSTLADAVQSMDREISKGSVGAADALKALGLTAKSFVGLDVDAKLALVSDQIKKMGLSSGQTSAALQGFGIRNKEMILAVQGGGDAFRDARKDIEDYGLGISSIQTDVIEEANDRIGRLGVIGQYAGQQLSLVLTPAIGAMAVAMTDSLREGGLLRSMIDGLVSVVKFGAENFGMIASAIAVMASTAIPAAVGGLVTLAGGFTTAGIAARAMGLAMTLAGGPLGLAVAAATALGIAIYSAWQPAKTTAETLNTLASAQDEVTRATKAFNVEMTTNSVNAMVAAAEANIGIIQNEIELTKKAWESANAWRLSLGPNEGMIAASEKIVMLQAAMVAAESTLAEKRAQAAAFVEQQVAGVVHLNDEQQKALQSANEMTRTYQDRAALAQTELRYGRESAQYLQEQLNQERQIQFAKIAALDITNQQKEAARKAYDQMVMAEAKTKGWNVELNTTNTRLNSAYQALVKIRDTQPGDGWLATAISKAAGLATKLWDAVAANNALANLSVSEGPGMTTGSSDWAKNDLGFTKPGSELIYQPPKTSGAGAGAAGGGTSGALAGLITDLQTERELLNVWYAEKLALIQSFTDLELEQLGGRHGALERLEAEHMERLRALGADTNNQRLSDMAGFFGGMAELAKSGGERTLKIAQGLAAVQGVINSYLAFTEVLKDPAYVGRPWARFGAAASALASGLAAVRSIKGASSGGGGGGVPGGAGSAGSGQQSAPETPLRVTLDTIDPGAIYSGGAMIKMFEAIQKEAGNRGIVWVPAGG